MQDEELQKLIETTQKTLKSITTTEEHTIIQFEDGEEIVLNGGNKMVGQLQKVPSCSFCGRPRNQTTPMISPDDTENILICSKCTVEALQMFIKAGVEIELDIPFSMKKQLTDQ